MAINKVSAGRGAAWINESITSLRTGGKTIWVPALLIGLLGSIPMLNVLQGILIIFFYASLVICISQTDPRSSVLSGFQNGNLNRLLPIMLLNIAFAILVVAILWPTLKVAVEAAMQGAELPEEQAIALVKSMLEHFIWLVPAGIIMHWLTQLAVPLASLGGLSGTAAIQQALMAIISNLPAMLVNLICLFIVMCLVVIIFIIPIALVGAATAGNTLLSNIFLIPITTVMTAIMLALLSGNMLYAYRDVFGQAEPVTKDSEVLI
jgi:hypothetical protein